MNTSQDLTARQLQRELEATTEPEMHDLNFRVKNLDWVLIDTVLCGKCAAQQQWSTQS